MAQLRSSLGSRCLAQRRWPIAPLRPAAPKSVRSGLTPRCHAFQQQQRHQPLAGRPARRIAAASAQEVQEQLEMQGADSAAALGNFLGWLVANGVQGIGTPDCKFSLYESVSGERGFIATQDITSGEELFRVPLRLALTAYADDPENSQLYEGAPWSVQLSAKLLRQAMSGPQSPWWPYVQVLPALVPAPLETFSWEDMQDIQYMPGQTKLHEYQWLVSDAYSRCAPEALGGASEEQFQWAMSLVHSRTFGNASASGGVGVHMLVPLVDMLNHGGDETNSGLLADPSHTSTDNVRWDIVRGEGDAWEMVVKTTADVGAGEQLLLSYGERCSDDFFLHYGFVPEANPHESVQLFGDLAEALEWHYQRQEAAGKLPEGGAAEQLYRTALVEAVRQQRQEAAEKPQRPGGQREQEEEDGNGRPVLVHAGGKLDPSLMLAFGSVFSSAAGAVGSLKAGAAAGTAAGAAREPAEGVQEHCLRMLQARCIELLQGFPTHLLQDMALLWADATAKGDEEAAARQLQLMEHYRQELQGSNLLSTLCSSTSTPSSGPVGAAAAAAAAAAGMGARAGVPLPAGGLPVEVFAWQTYQSVPRAQPHTSVDADEGAGAGSSGQGVAAAAGAAGAGAAGAAGEMGLTQAQQLLVRYRLNKKMVLADAVLATSAALAAGAGQ